MFSFTGHPCVGSERGGTDILGEPVDIVIKSMMDKVGFSMNSEMK